MIATASIAHPAMYRGDGTLWRRVQKVLATFAILGLAASAVAVSSLAVFTDQAQVTGNTFSTGTVNINATPATAVVTMPVMAPGDQVTAPLTVQNLGTLDLRYAMTSTTTEDVLAAALVMTIKTGVASCDNTGFASTGTQIYQGILGATTTSAIRRRATRPRRARRRPPRRRSPSTRPGATRSSAPSTASAPRG